MSDDDNGAYSLAQQALSEARDASSEAREALRVAERADDKADRALEELRELRHRVSELEEAVQQLINMLQAEIRTLIEQTQQVERAVQAQLLQQQQQAFNSACIGKTMPVLFTREGKLVGQMLGKSPYLQSVHVNNAEHLQGKIEDIEITAATQSSLTGELLLQPSHLRKAS